MNYSNETELMQIEASGILANHHRNFKINPIKKDQVAKLVESYRHNNDFGVIPVRMVMVAGEEFYEQASGHHRIAAMRELGYEWIDCKLLPADTTDGQMLSLMIDENAMQYGGDPAHQLDSVAAAAAQIAYWMFLSDDEGNFAEISAKSLFDSQRAFETAKGKLIESATIGHRTIAKFIGKSLSLDVVRDKVADLQATGQIAGIIETARLKANSIISAQEEADRMAEANRKLEEDRLAKMQKAEDARRKREAAKAVKAAKDAATKIEKQKALAEKRRIEDEAAKAKRIEKARQDEIARVKKENDARKARAQKQANDMAAAQSAADAKELAKTLHPDVSRMLKSTDMIGAVRGIFGHYIHIFPVDSQVDLITKMVKTLKAGNNFTTRDARSYLDQIVAQHDAVRRKQMEEKRRLDESASSQLKADNAVAEFRASIGRTASSMRAIGDLLNDDKHTVETLMSIQSDITFAKNLDNLENMIGQIRERIGVKTRDFNFKPEIKEVSGEIV